MPSLFVHLLSGMSANPLETALAIVLATFVLEDATMVAVGVLAADGIVSFPLGLASLATGIALGDFGLYGIGRLAISHPGLRRRLDGETFSALKSWLTRSLYPTVIAARFLPGARLPTYIACGLFSVSFARFGICVIGATIAWCTLLFVSSYYFGVMTLGSLGVWRWLVAVVLVAALYVAGRAYWNRTMENARG